MALWRHFYQTFTPTCTVCDKCANDHHSRDQNIPVDEGRFQRLQLKDKTPYQLAQESEFPVVPISEDCVEILHTWLAWTRHLVDGEAPMDFLPRYGVDMRTPAEIRRARLAQLAEEAGEVANDLPELSDSSEDEALDEQALQGSQAVPTSLEDDDDEDEGGDSAGFPHVQVSPSDRSIIISWLARARQNMRNPHLHNWSRLSPDMPTMPTLPPLHHDET